MAEVLPYLILLEEMAEFMKHTPKQLTMDEKIRTMEDYLRLKVSDRDWFEVARIAAKLDELETILKSMPDFPIPK